MNAFEELPIAKDLKEKEKHQQQQKTNCYQESCEEGSILQKCDIVC